MQPLISQLELTLEVLSNTSREKKQGQYFLCLLLLVLTHLTNVASLPGGENES